MPGARDMVVVGASAGGVEALIKLVRALPRGYAGSLFVVLHIAPESSSVLSTILARAGALECEPITDGELPKPGCAYVAPPNCHLLITSEGAVSLSSGPKENGHRPAIDPLFRSAAAAFGPRAVGIVLTGTRDDGTAGLQAIGDAGGFTIVQDPEEALYPNMPLNALEHVEVDAVRRTDEIARLLVELALDPMVREVGSVVRAEAAADARDPAEMESTSENGPGNSSGLTCPECSGALWESRNGEIIQYRCRVGHVYSLESMLSEQSRSLEAALWAGVAALEERAQLMRRVSERADRTGSGRVGKQFGDEAEQARQQARVLRRTVTDYAAQAPVVLDEPAGTQSG